MRPLLSALTSLAFLVMSTACAPAPVPPPAGPTAAELMSAADALDVRFAEAFSKGDVDGVMATYWNSPNLVSYGPDGMGTRGWDANKAGSTEMFKSMPGARLEFVERHNDVHGDVVLGWGTWKLTIPAPKGPPQVMEGRFSDVKAMHDGRMVYIMDHASVPLPPPPPPASAKKK